MNLIAEITEIKQQLRRIQCERTGQITRLKHLKKQLEELETQQKKRMMMKNLAKEFIEQNRERFEDKSIPLTPEQMEQIELFALRCGVSIEQMASVLLHGYLQDLQQKRDAIIQHLTPRN